jgi:RNA polymerase sigma-70 factor (ECF subfamily)
MAVADKGPEPHAKAAAPAPRASGAAEAELAAILVAVADADRAALRRLYETFGGRFYGIAFRILRDQSLAEDAVQEAFVKIWRNAGKFDPARGSALGWAAIIVRRAAFDLRPRDSGGELFDIPDERPETDMLHPGLARALDALPEMHRKALLLMYVYGLTHAELSAALGAPLGTVKSWVRRGAAALKEQVRDD